MGQHSTNKTEQTEKKNPQQGKVEGEGSYTATRDYDQHLKTSKGAAESERLAREAAQALDGPEGADLRHAEQQAKQGPAVPKRRA
jgi:hypothetical protein